MTQKYKSVKILVILGLFLISSLGMSILSVSADDSSMALRDGGGLISFGQYIELEFDKSELNKPLTIDQPVNVPITVTYTHDVPASFLSFIQNLAPLMYNKLIFGSMMAPQQQLKITISDNVDWADIYIDDPIVDIPIPEAGTSSVRKVNLVVTPYREAPAQPKSISVLAECDAVGSLKANSKEHTLTFTPVYIPRIDVVCSSPIRQVGPRENVNFDIKIKNNANKNTIVKLSWDAPEKWAPIMSPQEIYITPNGEETVVFSVTAPYDFGWHDYQTSMRIICQPYPDPMPADNLSSYAIAQVEQGVKVLNYGFSFSGAEPILAVVIVIAVAIILYLYKKTKN